MNYDYLISTCHWRFQSDYHLVDTPASAVFRTDSDSPDWVCTICQTVMLPAPRGKLISETSERRIFSDGETTWLELLNRKDGQPIFCASYPVSGGKVWLWSRADFYPYTARMEHIWSAVDFPFHLMGKGILTVHSASIEVAGGAVLFIAPSGTGKSTQARLWHELRGAKQLNGDKTGIGCRGGIVTAYGLPFCGTSDICTNFELPIRALVILSQAGENSVKRLTGTTALKAILENSFGHRTAPGCMERMISAAAKIIDSVPVYALACTPDERAVKTLENALKNEKIPGKEG